MEERRITYSAVILDNVSKDKLKQNFTHLTPDTWSWFGHHLTICMGELPEDLKSLIGTTVQLQTTQFGLSDMAAAVGVSGFDTTDGRKPHITLAVNKAEGGKPFMSNKITAWGEAPALSLTGTIEEVPFPPSVNESLDKMITLMHKL